MTSLAISPDVRRQFRRAAVKHLQRCPTLRTLLGDVTRSERHARKVRRMVGRK